MTLYVHGYYTKLLAQKALFMQVSRKVQAPTRRSPTTPVPIGRVGDPKKRPKLMKHLYHPAPPHGARGEAHEDGPRTARGGRAEAPRRRGRSHPRSPRRPRSTPPRPCKRAEPEPPDAEPMRHGSTAGSSRARANRRHRIRGSTAPNLQNELTYPTHDAEPEPNGPRPRSQGGRRRARANR